MGVVKHWQNEQIGTLQHSAFGTYTFISGVASNYPIFEIGSATKRCQLVSFLSNANTHDFHITVESASLILTSVKTHVAAEVNQWGPAAMTATPEAGRSTVNPQSGTGANHFIFMHNLSASAFPLHLGEMRWPIIANPGEVIAIKGSAVGVQLTGSIAWVEF